MSTPDPRAPLVIDVHDLGRRAGAMTRMELAAPAPDDLANPMIRVCEQTTIRLELMLESVIDGVLVSGEATARLRGTCGRCLIEIEDELTVEFGELFRYADQVDKADHEDESPVLHDDYLDLEPAIRDAFVLALPLAPHCREDCLGLCPECGVRLDDQPGHQHDRTDSRWAELAGIFAEDRFAGPN